jgi:Ca2+-binding EF-hand superfamily protein
MSTVAEIRDFCASLPDENTLALCMDTIDNDGNGFTDCADFSCSRSMDMAIVDFCRSRAEDTLARCMDEIDNDGNGFVDCEDFSCSRSMDPAIVMMCAERGEGTFARCKDGRDNDGNGFVDCADFSCGPVGRVAFDDAVVEVDPATMRLRAPCQESIGAAPAEARANCMDGLDNDQDGFADCSDWDCANNPDTLDLCPTRVCE